MVEDFLRRIKQILPFVVVFGIIFGGLTFWIMYQQFRIDVPERHIAVITHKSGKDLENNMEVAPDASYKGLQLEVMNEGRRFVNPLYVDWEIYPMIEIPEGMMGVRIRLYGDDLGYGHFVATKENQKGIIEEVLRPGRYPINAIVKDQNGQIITPRDKKDYVEIIELHEPVTIPAGFKGVITNLAGPLPDSADDYEVTQIKTPDVKEDDDSIKHDAEVKKVNAPKTNQLLVKTGFRGVQAKTLAPGTYYKNPYMWRIEAIDCRSQRFNLAENEDMGFPSKDGFWVSLDGIIEFRVHPESAAEVYVTYNESTNDEGNKHAIDEEIIRKVIMPNARAFCRLHGSNASGREFIGGETRTAFQAEFQKTINATCGKQGIDIIQALITRIHPPQAIAEPVRKREVSAQELTQYDQEKLRAEEKAKLQTETALIEQKKELVKAEKTAIEKIAEADKEQGVALEEANRDLEVAKEDLLAAKDKAEAILAERKAEAAVIMFENEADAAGWKKSVEALGGDGENFARFILYQKLAPSYRSIMTNTADSPLMDVFKTFERKDAQEVKPPMKKEGDK